MSEHGHPTWWSWVVVIGGCLTTLLISVVISVQTNQRAIDREREARLASELEFCSLLKLFDDSYREVPPNTPTGINLAKGLREYRQGKCPPEPITVKEK
jgi:hypothetical protein